MKKLIVLGALSVLFYSAPGHAVDPGTAVEGAKVGVEVGKAVLGPMADATKAKANKQAHDGFMAGLQNGRKLVFDAVRKAWGETLAKAVKAGKLEAAESTLLAKDVNDALAEIEKHPAELTD